jgi:OPA family glycerol-3-phosphate transporter-like MFS transporter
VSAVHTARWQRITLLTLFTGYAGYYLCRTNLSVVAPLLLNDSSGTGLTEESLGSIASVGVLLYAIGKVTNGVLTDFLGGRLLFISGMAISVLCTVLFGLGRGLVALTIVWAVNRYVQSMGWGALVKIAARWFPVARRASVMGVLSLSYLLGDAVVRLYLGSFIGAGAGWRGVFFLSAGTLAAFAVVSLFTLKGSPRDVGAEEPAANPANVFGSAGESPHPDGLWQLLLPFLRSPVFWLVCLMNMGLTLIRETFNFWTPTYLTRAVGLDEASAAQLSLVFPLVGAASALAGGWLSDRLGGRHGLVALPAMLALVAVLWVLAETPTHRQPVRALLLVSGVSFCLMAPYSFCSGVIALDLGGKRGSSTSAGLIDGAGYLGATLSGVGVGAIAQHHGWPAAFTALVGVAALTALATILYCVVQPRPLPRSQEKLMAPDSRRAKAIHHLYELFEKRGHEAYFGEAVSQLEHALQTAWAAEKAGADSDLIAAALLHDIGHLLHHLPEKCADDGLDDRHEQLGARWVERYFGPDVSEPIRLHVPAKRYLSAAEPSYRDRLSPASQRSLELQGGPFSAAEIEQFRRGPRFEAAVALRRWDEQAKIPALPTPGLDYFHPHLEAAQARQE